MKKNYKEFYKGMIIPLAAFALYAAFATALLLRAGEYWPMEKVVVKQLETKGIYGSALYERTFLYKQTLYRHSQPEVAALGSSRVLQFRDDVFSKPFFNIASMHNIDEGTEMVDALFEAHAPKILLLGVDVWWFHPVYGEDVQYRSPDAPSIRAYDLMQPINWISTGKTGPGDIFRILAGTSPNIGISGITQGNGFDIDGSNHYTAILTGETRSYDIKFKDTLGKIKKGTKFFSHSDKMSETHWKKFEALIEKLHKKKIHIVLFLPPLPPSALTAMEKEGKNYAYIKEVRQRLYTLGKKFSYPVFDYHDTRTLGATDCEFVDGLHGGEIVYNRMLLNMALNDKKLRNVLNLPDIGWNIKTFSGRASTRKDEIDFLKIGCKK